MKKGAFARPGQSAPRLVAEPSHRQIRLLSRTTNATRDFEILHLASAVVVNAAIRARPAFDQDNHRTHRTRVIRHEDSTFRLDVLPREIRTGRELGSSNLINDALRGNHCRLTIGNDRQGDCTTKHR